MLRGRFANALYPCNEIPGVFVRSRRLSINAYVNRRGRRVRIKIEHGRVRTLVPRPYQQPAAFIDLYAAAEIGASAFSAKVESLDDPSVVNQLEVIDRHHGTQESRIRELSFVRVEKQNAARPFA